MYKKILIGVLLLALVLPGWGQMFYYLDSLSRFNDSKVMEPGIFNIQTCEKDTIFNVGNYLAFDIVRTPSDSFYLYTSDRKDLQKDLQLRFYNLKYDFVQKKGDFTDNSAITALTVDVNGIVYAAGTGLSLYFPATNNFEFIGDLPADMQAGGDLMFYKGELYLTTINNTLVKVDVNNPQNSTVYMTFPPGTPLVDGLAVYPYHCENIEVYAISRDAGGSNIYRLDMEDQTLTLLCETPYHIWGASTDIEWQIPVCFNLDLDENDSSQLPGNDFRTDTLCAPPSRIVDSDLHIRIEGLVDSISIQLSGIANAGAEYLQAVPVPGISILGNNSPRITLINQDNVDEFAFESALQQLQYFNTATGLTYGQRTATFTMYRGAEAAAPARALITLEENRLDYAVTVQDISCAGRSDGRAIFLGSDNYTLTWEDNSTTREKTDLERGIHRFRVENEQGCGQADSLMIDEPAPLLISIQADWDTVCRNEGRLLVVANGGTPGYTYSWDATATGPELAGIPSGTYQVEVSDTRACMANATYTLFPGDQINVRETLNLCPDETFMLDGLTISINRDTTICRTFPTQMGCDSIHCFELKRSVVSLEIPEFLSLKFGDSLLIEPIVNFAPQLVHWSPGEGLNCADCLDVFLRPLQSTTYHLEVVSPDGCTLKRELEVEVKILDQLYIPNVFSPNGDGVNDTFGPIAPGIGMGIRSLHIFNRWGQLVFDRKDLNPDGSEGWNGMDQRNQPVADGVYLYRIELEKPGGTIEVKTGDITVIR